MANRHHPAALRSREAFADFPRKRVINTDPSENSPALAFAVNNAFSRYETGKATLRPAVLNLFKLLDKHPERLKELVV